MRVGLQDAEASIANALSMAGLFSLKNDAAVAEVRIVVAAVEDWKKHFAKAGVSARDIESYAGQIDRPFLKEQRAEYAPRAKAKGKR
jgi:serine/threonine-protein kinase HipA